MRHLLAWNYRKWTLIIYEFPTWLRKSILGPEERQDQRLFPEPSHHLQSINTEYWILDSHWWGLNQCTFKVAMKSIVDRTPQCLHRAQWWHWAGTSAWWPTGIQTWVKCRRRTRASPSLASDPPHCPDTKDLPEQSSVRDRSLTCKMSETLAFPRH